jgi:hypothetical protein
VAVACRLGPAHRLTVFCPTRLLPSVCVPHARPSNTLQPAAKPVETIQVTIINDKVQPAPRAAKGGVKKAAPKPKAAKVRGGAACEGEAGARRGRLGRPRHGAGRESRRLAPPICPPAATTSSCAEGPQVQARQEGGRQAQEGWQGQGGQEGVELQHPPPDAAMIGDDGSSPLTPPGPRRRASAPLPASVTASARQATVQLPRATSSCGFMSHYCVWSRSLYGGTVAV